MNADAFSKTLNDVTYREPERIFYTFAGIVKAVSDSQKCADFSIRIII